MDNHTVDLLLSVNGGASPTAADRLAASLLTDLRAARVGRVDRRSEAGEAGSKSGIAPLVGQLTVSGMASTSVWLLHKTLVAFLDRSKARSVTIKTGTTEIELTAATKDEVAQVLALAIRPADDQTHDE